MTDLLRLVTAHLPDVVRRPLGKVYRRLRSAGRQSARHVETGLAALWRRLLVRTTVIAITGSLGKTTTRELLHAVLAEDGSCIRTAKNENSGPGPRRLLLATRPWHRYCVIELGIGKAGDMARHGRLVRPDVVLLLNVARCHLNTFRHTAAVLGEKIRIVEYMPRGGRIVTNDVFPEIASLSLPANVKRIRFSGWRAPTCDAAPAAQPTGVACRLISAHSHWPDRMTVEVEQTGEGRVVYTTQLNGEHWANAVVAVVAASRALGIPTPTIAAALSSVPNWESRLQPVALRERDATYVRDDYNGSIDTYRSSLAWLSEASTGRRIVVYGNASDMVRAGGNRRRAMFLAREVVVAADHVVAVTPYPDVVRRVAAESGLDASRVTTLSTVHEAIDWCRAGIRDGDLLLCKGRYDQKFERVFLGLFGEVVCQRDKCDRKKGCDGCPELGFEPTPAMRAGVAAICAPSRAAARQVIATVASAEASG